MIIYLDVILAREFLVILLILYAVSIVSDEKISFYKASIGCLIGNAYTVVAVYLRYQ